MNEVDLLADDAIATYERIAIEDTQLNRRNYVRALFAFYDGALSDLREQTAQLMITFFELKGEWKIHELSPLMDDRGRLANNGKLTIEPNRLPFKELVAYTFKKYAELTKSELDVLSDNGWNEFKKSIKIRHRITHPKFHSDVDISDEELDSLEAGRIWWDSTIHRL